MKIKGRKAYVTYLLIAVNLCFFYLEMISGGTENLDTLYNLGALVPQEIWLGEWWRLLNANFLHFGWLHLSTNMLGLYFLGRFVEISIGSLRYTIAYLLSGIGAMLAFSIVAIKVGETDQILVGASAAIMGLIGVIVAIFWQAWHQEKSHLAARRLKVVISIVGLQFIFDLFNPQISFLSHVLGLVIGVFMGFVLLKI
jgi:rhomboid protease GluP